MIACGLKEEIFHELVKSALEYPDAVKPSVVP